MGEMGEKEEPHHVEENLVYRLEIKRERCDLASPGSVQNARMRARFVERLFLKLLATSLTVQN